MRRFEHGATGPSDPRVCGAACDGGSSIHDNAVEFRRSCVAPSFARERH